MRPSGTDAATTIVSSALVVFATLLALAPVDAREQRAPPSSERTAPAHWPPGTRIPVWIDPTDAPEHGLELVARAMAAWTRAAGGRLQLQRASRADEALTGIRVRFMRSGSLYGETVPRVDRRTGFIVQADVYVAGDARGTPLDTQIALYLTALHELGHALGLAHTDRFADIMYRFRAPDDGARYFGRYRQRLRGADDVGTRRASGLSADDIQELKVLYGIPR